MAIKRFERYPGRYLDATDEQPQGAFKDRTAPNANDGSYLQADWLNDFSGFFSALLNASGEVASGTPDTATDSQYLRGMQSFIPKNSVSWQSEAIFSDDTVPAEAKWCKIAKLKPSNGVFSGLFAINVIDSADNQRSVTFFACDGFSTSPFTERQDAYLLYIACSELASNEIFLRIVRYSNTEAYLEVKVSTIRPTDTSVMTTTCGAYTLLGQIEPINTLDVSEITASQPTDDARIKAYTNVQRNRIKLNQSIFFNTNDYPISQTYAHGLVQLSNDLITADSKGNEKAATLNATQALKTEIDALQTSDATNFAGDARYFDALSQRGLNIDYTNNTANMIKIYVATRTSTGAGEVEVFVDGLSIIRSYTNFNNYKTMSAGVIVPVGSVYQVRGSTLYSWVEFRSASAPIGANIEDSYFYSVDGLSFKAFDERLSDEDVEQAGYTLRHLSYQSFMKENEKNIVTNPLAIESNE